MPQIVFVDREFAHHGQYSGYKQLVRYVEGSSLYAGRLPSRWVPDSLIYRLPGLHPRWYNRRSLEIEARLLVTAATTKGLVFHFLYGEHSYRFVGRINRWLGTRNRIVATFHQPSEFFEVRRARLAHIRELDAAILVNSNQRSFFDTVLSSDLVHVVPHGVDVDYFCPPRLRRVRPSIRCLTVGTNYRDFDSYVKVIRNLNRSHLKNAVEFVIIGEERYAHYFVGLDNVRFISNISDRDLLAYYQASDFMVLPLSAITASNALLEGMACALPIIITDVPGVRDYVNEQSAILVSSKNDEEMTEYVQTLVGDPQRRIELGERARQHVVANFDWRFIAKRVANVYAATCT